MRFLSLQSPTGLPYVRMLYEELSKHEILIDAVVAPVEKGRADRLIKDRGLTGLFAHDEWIVPLTEIAIAKDMRVVVFLRDLSQWYELEESGLARQVNLFIFDTHDLYNRLNRNLNHVVIEDIRVDTEVLVAVLQNMAKHHKCRRPSVRAIRKVRTKKMALAKQVCEAAYHEKPSFTEMQYFLDAMHSDNERQRLILNLRAVLARKASVREIRGLVDPPKVKEVVDGA